LFSTSIHLCIGLRLFARRRPRGRREPAPLEIDHRHEPGFTNLFERKIERLFGFAVVEDDAPAVGLAVLQFAAVLCGP